MRRAVGISVSAAVCLVAVAGTVLVSETATIVLSLPAHLVQAKVTLTGGRDSGDLPTRKLTVRVTDSLEGRASRTTVSTFASGEVVFTWYSQCTSQCSGLSLRVVAGADVSTAGGIHYVTLADAWFTKTSQPVPVRAVVPGPSGNAGPGTIVKFGSAPTDMGVINPKAISGGASRETQIITESDYDAVLRALVKNVIDHANNAMREKALGWRYAIVGPPDVQVVDDHYVGDEAPSFTITATASLDVNAFSEIRVRSLLVHALSAKVRSDEQMTDDAIRTNYAIDWLKPNGDLLVTGTAVGSAIPRISTGPLKTRIAFMNIRQADSELMRTIPGARVEIHVAPDGVPWLPLIPGRILFKVAAQPGAA
jgi:hypothetical protein